MADNDTEDTPCLLPFRRPDEYEPPSSLVEMLERFVQDVIPRFEIAEISIRGRHGERVDIVIDTLPSGSSPVLNTEKTHES